MEKYQNYLLALRTPGRQRNIIQRGKKENTIYSHNGCRQRLACSFMPACLRCRTPVDTNVLPYELCCSVQGRLKTVFLCLRYVDTVALGTWFVLAWCAQRKKSRFENQNFVVFVIVLHMAIRADDTANSLQEEHLPCSHVHLAVGTPQCHDLDRQERLCRELATLEHTRARFLLLAVLMVLLYYGWFWCCYFTAAYSLVLSSCNEKTKEKKARHKKQRKQRTSGRFFSPTTNFLVGNYGLRRA